MTSYAHWQSHFCHIEFPYYIIFFEKKTLRFRGFFNTFSIGGGRSCNRLLCHNEKTKHENLLAGYRRRYDVLQAAVEHRSSTIIETAAILLKLQTAGNVYKILKADYTCVSENRKLTVWIMKEGKFWLGTRKVSFLEYRRQVYKWHVPWQVSWFPQI